VLTGQPGCGVLSLAATLCAYKHVRSSPILRPDTITRITSTRIEPQDSRGATRALVLPLPIPTGGQYATMEAKGELQWNGIKSKVSGTKWPAD
jgi:hypothetical protein